MQMVLLVAVRQCRVQLGMWGRLEWIQHFAQVLHALRTQRLQRTRAPVARRKRHVVMQMVLLVALRQCRVQLGMWGGLEWIQHFVQVLHALRTQRLQRTQAPVARRKHGLMRIVSTDSLVGILVGPFPHTGSVRSIEVVPIMKYWRNQVRTHNTTNIRSC